MEHEILSPRSDLVFKLIFGDARNTDILAAFLQSILDLPAEEYAELAIIDPHLRQEAEDDKLGILDVRIVTKAGKIINVEIQVERIPGMRERIVFYTAKLVAQQIKKGESYEAIKRVISIIIADHILVPENTLYHNCYRLYDEKSGSRFTDLVEIDTLELPKLPQKADDSELWNWMRFLKVERKEELAMIAETNPQIKKAVGVLMELSQDERTRLLYEEREKARRDELARIRGARAEGLAEGLTKGIAEGLTKGIAEGLTKGIAEGLAKGEAKGRTEEKIEIARSMLKRGMSADEVSAITGLSNKEIESLTAE